MSVTLTQVYAEVLGSMSGTEAPDTITGDLYVEEAAQDNVSFYGAGVLPPGDLAVTEQDDAVAFIQANSGDLYVEETPDTVYMGINSGHLLVFELTDDTVTFSTRPFGYRRAIAAVITEGV